MVREKTNLNKTKKVDLIIQNARQLVTCAGHGEPKKGDEMKEVGIVKKGAIAIRNGKIVGVGTTGEIKKQFESEKLLNAGDRAIIPSFVECHTHIVYGGNRLDEFELKIKGADYIEILESGGGIISTVKKTREKSVEDLVSLTKKRLDKMLKLGVTTCEIKTGYGLETETELKMLEVIEKLDQSHPIDLVPTFLPAHAIPPEFREKEGGTDKYVDLICREMLPLALDWYSKSHFNIEKTQDSRLKTQDFFIDVFCEKGAFDLKQSKRVIRKASELGFKIKAHVDEFTNLGCAGFAVENGATTIDHLDAISEGEMDLLARSKTVGVITPTVNFNFGSKDFADARKLIDKGCAIALSTDYNPGSAPCPSLPNAMAIACRYQKLLPAEALNAVTFNSAFGVGAGERIGSIEVGKQADFLILETDDYREICYEFGGNLIESVIKDGRILDN